MSNWKLWLENRMRDDRLKQIRQIWSDTFKSLGIGGLSDEDAAHQSLSRINFNDRNSDHSSTFKGKQAALKRLENGQIFQRLQQLQDPELVKTVENVKQWLGDKDETGPNASTTVSTLLQKLFGPYFQNLIDSDMADIQSGQDKAVAQVEPQPPQDNLGPQGPDLNGEDVPPMDIDPNQMSQMPPGKQPQVPQPVQPQNPMSLAHHNIEGESIFENWLNEKNLSL